MTPEKKFNHLQPSQFLIDCWNAGVASVRGQTVVQATLAEYGPQKIDRLFSVGKAASSMSLGAVDFMKPEAQGLVITKYGHADQWLLKDQRFQVIESAHPVPDPKSLEAGAEAIEFMKSAASDHAFVMLVSGGASSLVEVLAEGLDLEFLASLTNAMLANGLDIGQMNAVRARISQIKGGKLLSLCNSKCAQVLLISDVQSDDPAVIGSGIGSSVSSVVGEPLIPKQVESMLVDVGANPISSQEPANAHRFNSRIIASNTLARNASADFARSAGLDIVANEESLYGDIREVVERIANRLLRGPGGVYIFGGEPTIVLPSRAGIGGRMQHFALEMAKLISGREGFDILAAGTDGSDGPTDAAGGIADGTLFEKCRGANAALRAADAGSYLEQAGGLLVTGPTGTNVMDLVIALKRQQSRCC